MKQYINGAQVKSTNYKKYAALLDAYRHAVNVHGNLILCYETPYNTYYIDAAGL